MQKEPKNRRVTWLLGKTCGLRLGLSGATFPRTPVFTGEQDRVVQRPISGVEVSRRSLPLIVAAALLAVVASCWAPGTRLLPAGTSIRRSTVGR